MKKAIAILVLSFIPFLASAQTVTQDQAAQLIILEQQLITLLQQQATAQVSVPAPITSSSSQEQLNNLARQYTQYQTDLESVNQKVASVCNYKMNSLNAYGGTSVVAQGNQAIATQTAAQTCNATEAAYASEIEVDEQNLTSIQQQMQQVQIQSSQSHNGRITWFPLLPSLPIITNSPSYTDSTDSI